MSLIKDLLESKQIMSETHESLETEVLQSFPPNDNPFRHDQYHIGSQIGSNVIVMYSQHFDEKQKYIIICDITTGKRLRVFFE